MGYFEIGPSYNKQICLYVCIIQTYIYIYVEIAEKEFYKRKF